MLGMGIIMKVLYFDCFSGISGDMSLGAMLDLGIDINEFKKELNKLKLEGYEIVIQKTVKNGITGTDVEVLLIDHDDHEHGDQHDHEHGDQHDHKHDNDQHGGRNFKNIVDLINASDLRQKVKDFSIKVFKEIAKAEAKVHNKTIDEVHFHEVGAIDSIVDIVGAAICVDLLCVDRVYSSPLHDGYGFIKCQHGIIPVPVPAVLEILAESKIPLITEDINTELVTPTGAGIIKCLAESFSKMPSMIIEKIGYGMGKKDTGRLNALRVVLGTLSEEDNLYEEISVLETNIDDMSSEILGFTAEKLFECGALDVFFTPIYMKKNRPATILTVLAKKEQEELIVDTILKQTSTLGVRRSISGRYCMKRETVIIKTEFGDMRIKFATKGEIIKWAPEYEDCKTVANKTGMPLHTVYAMVNEHAAKLQEGLRKRVNIRADFSIT